MECYETSLYILYNLKFQVLFFIKKSILIFCFLLFIINQCKVKFLLICCHFLFSKILLQQFSIFLPLLFLFLSLKQTKWKKYNPVATTCFMSVPMFNIELIFSLYPNKYLHSKY